MITEIFHFVRKPAKLRYATAFHNPDYKRIESSNERRSRNSDSFIAVNITAPKNQQHIPGISHHGRYDH